MADIVDIVGIEKALKKKNDFILKKSKKVSLNSETPMFQTMNPFH